MLITGTDHSRCRGLVHRTRADASLGEEADAAGWMVCGHCGKPLARCAKVAANNKNGSEYERAYFHPNHKDEESCFDRS